MKEKTPFIKRPGVQTALASLLCAVLGILIGFIVLLLMNPAHAAEIRANLLWQMFRMTLLSLTKTDVPFQTGTDRIIAVFVL